MTLEFHQDYSIEYSTPENEPHNDFLQIENVNRVSPKAPEFHQDYSIEYLTPENEPPNDFLQIENENPFEEPIPSQPLVNIPSNLSPESNLNPSAPIFSLSAHSSTIKCCQCNLSLWFL